MKRGDNGESKRERRENEGAVGRRGKNTHKHTHTWVGLVRASREAVC